MAGSRPRIGEVDRERFSEDWRIGIPVIEMGAMWAITPGTVSATARRFGLEPRKKPRPVTMNPRDRVLAGRGHWEFDQKRHIQVWVANT